MSASQTIEVICRICGQPLTLSAVPDDVGEPLRSTLLQLAERATHDSCAASHRNNKLQQERIRLLELRTQAWGGICPPLYQNTDSSRLPVAQRMAEKFAQAVAWSYGPKGLGLFGSTGGGKTRTAYLVLEREFIDGKSIVAVTHTEFSGQATRLAVSDRKGEQQRWLKLMKSADILFIDDLGKSRFTTAAGDAKHAEEALWDVCEHRWQQMLPLFFTCNFRDGDALAAAMSDDKGQAFVRRLREFCIIIPF